MTKKNPKNTTVGLLLASVGLANIGEWIYFIALNMMILNDGGNALSVGLLYIIRPAADILTNIVFSTYIDRLHKKKWMVLLSLFRSFLIGLLIFNQELFFIYMIVFLIQVCISIYEPLSVGYMTLAIPENKRKKFNSWNNLVSSGGFLIGPGIAGFLLSIGTPLIAITVNSLALLISSMLLRLLPDYTLPVIQTDKISFLKDNKEALIYLKRYFQTNRIVVFFYLLISSLFVLAAGLDSVEAAFSKEVLFMSDSQYGLLVSISGVGFLIGSILNSLIVEKMSSRQLILFGGFSYIAGYLTLSLAYDFMSASIGFFLISFALAYINTGFRTFIQNAFPTHRIGQLLTAFNIVNSLIEMVIVASVSSLGSIFPLRVVLITTELVMIVIFICIIHSSKRLKKNQLENNKEQVELID